MTTSQRRSWKATTTTESTSTTLRWVTWPSGSGVGRINQVARQPSALDLQLEGCEFNSRPRRCRVTTQPPRPTQRPTLCGKGNEYRPRGSALWLEVYRSGVALAMRHIHTVERLFTSPIRYLSSRLFIVYNNQHRPHWHQISFSLFSVIVPRGSCLEYVTHSSKLNEFFRDIGARKDCNKSKVNFKVTRGHMQRRYFDSGL